ncbi:hypothetical protein ACLOJK_033384 [Asimina triloba]
MASKSPVFATFFLSVNLLLFSFAFAFAPPATCPIDALRLRACVNLLGVGAVVANPQAHPCCSLISGIADLEAAVCLCTAIRANVLGLNLNVPVAIRVVLNNCRRPYPNDFQCVI